MVPGVPGVPTSTLMVWAVGSGRTGRLAGGGRGGPLSVLRCPGSVSPYCLGPVICPLGAVNTGGGLGLVLRFGLEEQQVSREEGFMVVFICYWSGWARYKGFFLCYEYAVLF